MEETDPLFDMIRPPIVPYVVESDNVNILNLIIEKIVDIKRNKPQYKQLVTQYEINSKNLMYYNRDDYIDKVYSYLQSIYTELNDIYDEDSQGEEDVSPDEDISN